MTKINAKFCFYVIFVILSTILIFLVSYGERSRAVECKNCNIILISIDTLRADHLGIYGYKKNTSPKIDYFFKKGFIFKNAFAQAPNTLPSHMSMLTGLYPSHHKLISVYDNESLSNDYRTIAEILKLYDYRTLGFYSGSSLLDKKYGFGRGFDEYIVNNFVSNDTELFTFLNSTKNSKFFVFLHTDNVHDPYLSVPPFDTMFDKNYNGTIIGNYYEFVNFSYANNINFTFENYDQLRLLYWSRVNKSDPRDIRHLISLYDDNIYETDNFFGKLIDELKELNLSQKTIIIITADHGEEFNEHGGFLHEKLYDETIHVPLLIYVPNSKTQIIANQVGSIDIMPTILSVTGFTSPQEIDGRSLKFLMENPKAQDTNQVLYSEFIFQRAIRTPEWKLIKTVNKNVSYEFFDLKNDPGEKINMQGKNNTNEKELLNDLQNWEIKMNSTYLNVNFINSTFIGYP